VFFTADPLPAYTSVAVVGVGTVLPAFRRTIT